MFLGLQDPDNSYEVQIRLQTLLTSSKNSKKTLIPTVSRLLYDFLSLKNDVSVAWKSTGNTQKNVLSSWRSWTKIAGSGVGSLSQRLRGTDQRIRIRTKMARIHNTRRTIKSADITTWSLCFLSASTARSCSVIRLFSFLLKSPPIFQLFPQPNIVLFSLSVTLQNA